MFSSGSGYTSIKKGLILFFFGSVLYAQEQKGGSSFPKLDTPKPNYGLLTPEEKVEDYSFLDTFWNNPHLLMNLTILPTIYMKSQICLINFMKMKNFPI